MKDFLEIMKKWISTTLALGIPHDKTSLTKLSYALNIASEEFLQCRMNMLQSVDGRTSLHKQSTTFHQIQEI